MKLKQSLKTLAIICYSYSIRFCLGIQRAIKNRILRYVIFLLAAPFLLLWCLGSIVWEHTVGLLYAVILKQMEKNKDFSVELAVVVIVKNEAPYIQEWIEYYRLLGVEKIYLYDNGSTDDTPMIIKPYIDNGFIVYHDFPGKKMQLPAYDHAIRHYHDRVRWMIFIDCDEFLMPTDPDIPLNEIIQSIYSKRIHAGGIAVNWCIYGSSGKKIKEPGLLMERFQMRAANQAWNNKLIKTIVNPRFVKKYISPHFPQYKPGVWSIDTKGKRVFAWFIDDVDFSKIRCNHFFCKSVEEFEKKQARGLADRTNKHYDMTKFNEYDINDIYDDSMSLYIDEIKKSIYGAD